MNKVTFIFLDGSEVCFDLLKDDLIIGRDPSCDLVLPFQGFSRKHVRLELIGGKIYVTDLKSSNGVMINGKKISPGTRTLFDTSTNLQFGPIQSAVFKFEDVEATRVRGITLEDLQQKQLKAIDHAETRVMQIPKIAKTKSETTKKSKLIQVKTAPVKKSMIVLPLIVVVLVVAGLALYYFGVFKMF